MNKLYTREFNFNRNGMTLPNIQPHIKKTSKYALKNKL